ncbi:MAG: YncE family protein [Spirochaetales bacterium]|nr:YncE family protein [Spirochaetales bacterium]
MQDDEDRFQLTLKTFPEECTLFSGSVELSPVREYQIPEGTPCGNFKEYSLPGEYGVLTITAPGYRPKVIRLDSVSSDYRDANAMSLEVKLEPFGTGLRFLSLAETGEQPKSVEFLPYPAGPFGDLLAVALLRGQGVEFFNSHTGELVKKVNIPEPYGSQLGFVESVYLPERKELWVSQMDSQKIHIINVETLSYIASVPSGGIWTKVLTASPEGDRVYASNWLSENLGVIDPESRELEMKIPLSGIPRGSAFTPDGQYLYVCIYETGNIEKIEASTGLSLKVIETGPGAARHIVYNDLDNLFYISDMWHGSIYTLNPVTDRVVNRMRVAPNLNTIKLSKDGKYLFVSSRGRNNPETYLIKGAEFGSVSVIDTQSFKIIDRVYGGNQPTGLALSEDNRTLIFSDFLDRRLEFYNIDSFY